MLTHEMRGEALDVDFHWVNESGKPAKLTAGATIQPTVSNCKMYLVHHLIHDSILSRHVLRSTSL